MKFLIYLIVITAACGNINSNEKGLEKPSFNKYFISDAKQDSTKDDSMVYANISQLKEVKEKSRFVQKLSDNMHGISIIIQARPSASLPYFWVQVGYINEKRLEVYYNFYVFKKNWEIKYLDVLTNKTLSLEEWRKSENYLKYNK